MNLTKVKSLPKPGINIQEDGVDSIKAWLRGEKIKHEFDFDGSEESLARKINSYFRFKK